MISGETSQKPTSRGSTRSFDSLAFAKRLQAGGVFSREQAETLAEEQAALIDERLATKEDVATVNVNIEALRLATKEDIATINANIEALRLKTKADIENAVSRSQAETIKWVAGIVFTAMLAIIGAMAALVKIHT